MKGHHLTAVRLFSLFLIACIGIGNESWGPLFSTSLNNDYDSHRERRLGKGTGDGKGDYHSAGETIAANNAIIFNTNGTTKSLSQSPLHIQQDHVIISGKRLTYRYPQSFSETKLDTSNNRVLVVGVLSHAKDYWRRQGIRKTWAENDKGRVFFLVAGDWSQIESEFQQVGDLIWVDIEEQWLHLTYKVQMFYHAVEKHYGSPYKYIMKTDDDSYVALGVFNLLLLRKKNKVDFFGGCMRAKPPIRDKKNRYYVSEEDYPYPEYPPYAQGLGYVVSKNINKCMVDKLATVNYLAMEDAATGILIQECHSTCSHMRKSFELIEHHLKDNESKQQLHIKWKPFYEMTETSQLRMIIDYL